MRASRLFKIDPRKEGRRKMLLIKYFLRVSSGIIRRTRRTRSKWPRHTWRGLRALWRRRRYIQWLRVGVKSATIRRMWIKLSWWPGLRLPHSQPQRRLVKIRNQHLFLQIMVSYLSSLNWTPKKRRAQRHRPSSLLRRQTHPSSWAGQSNTCSNPPRRSQQEP